MTDTQDRLSGLIREYLDRDPDIVAFEMGKELGQLMLVGDLGADSLDMVELTMAIEEEFVIEITDAEGDPHASGAGRPLAELIELIDRKLAEKAKAVA